MPALPALASAITTSLIDTPRAADATPQTLRVAAYLRFSSAMQRDGYSLEAQRAEILKEADRQAARSITWQITWFEEPERSARAEKINQRTVFAQLLDEACAGRYDAVVVWRLDRFARSLKHQLTFIEQLQRAGVNFTSLYERTDFSTAGGRLAAHMFGAFAQFYSDQLSENVLHGMEQRAEVGLHRAAVPFGYRRVDKKTPVAPDTRPNGEWEGYHLLKRLSLDGAHDEEIADALNADGRWPIRNGRLRRATKDGPPIPKRWSRAAVRSVRTNPFYRPFQQGDPQGTITWLGKEYRGQHVAACTWDEWRTMQTLHAGHHRGWKAAAYPEQREAEFRGLVACADCVAAGRDGRAYLTTHNDPSTDEHGESMIATHEYYHCEAKRKGYDCPHNRHYAYAEDVRLAWLGWASAHLRLPPDWEEALVAHIEALASAAAGLSLETQAALQHEQARLGEKRRAVIELRADALVSRDEARARIGEIDRELARISARLRPAQIAQMGQTLRDAGRYLFNRYGQITDQWGRMTKDEREQIAQTLIQPNGLIVRLIAKGRRWGVKKDSNLYASSCELVEVRLREPFAEMLATLRRPSVSVASQ